MTAEADTETSRPQNLTMWMRRVLSAPIRITAQGLARRGISANAVTIGGFLLTIGAAWLAMRGATGRAGLVYLIGTALDGMDGAVARAGGKISSFGALLDSALDRYGEAAMLTAIGYRQAVEGNTTGVVLVILGLFGSVMVSYMRARSEGLGVHSKRGLMTRVERVIVVALSLLTGWIIPGLWILAVLSHVTAFQRLWILHRATRDRGIADGS